MKARLIAGLNELGLKLDDNQIEALLAYLNLLARWNKSYNLTAISDPEKMLNYHLLDSLSIAKWFDSGESALDVGSGAGLPGIPLAIAKPQSKWILLDSNGKKTRFMQQAVAVCALSNATVVKSRVEDYHASEPLDIIVSRAYASLGDFVDSVAHLMQSQTRLMTMKTGSQDDNPAFLESNQYQIEEQSLQVPGILQSRKLVIVRHR